MRHRVVLIAVVATALVIPGCSVGKPSLPTPVKSSSAQATASASAKPDGPTEEPAGSVETLDADACVEVTGANLDLATANTQEDARKAGDAFENYDLPSDVHEAVEHFVETNGMQFDDPDFDKYNSTIDDWVKQVCPL